MWIQSEAAGSEHVPPRNEAEQKLARIWEDVLEVDNISVHDDFFALGGHSLLAIRLISAIRKEFKVEVPISDVFDYPTIAGLAHHFGEAAGAVITPMIQSVKPRPAFIPLSFSQERLWFIDQLDGSIQYHVPSVLRLKGSLNKTALAYAIQTIVNRHEVLRTVIRENTGQASQHVMEAGLWQLATSEGIKYKAYREQLQDHIQDLINAPFDLTKDHMLRAELITINEQEHVLVVVMHHIASDGWSASLLVKEVVALYKSFVEGLAVTLEPMKFQYADFAIWQRSYLEGETLQNKLAYWESRLAGVATLDLPTDYPRPPVQSSKGAIRSFRLPKKLQAELQELNQQHGTTMFMTLLAAFKVLLFRYSAQQDICVGTAVAGRQHQELENLIGFFINTLALRTEINPSDSFVEVLRKVKLTTLEAYENQDVPFEKVVTTVVKDRDMSRSPLFQVMFALQNTPPVPELLFGEVKLTREPFSQDKTKFDLSVVLTEDAHGLQGIMQYCTDLYSEQRILRMIEHFELLLHAVVLAPSQNINLLSILSPIEQEQLLHSFNRPVKQELTGRTILDLFAAQVSLEPTAIALSHHGIPMSYQELHDRSDQLASYLVNKGIQQESLVPVCMNRSPEMVVAMLGIMKAGGAYVPIDPGYPAERIGFMLADCKAGILLTNSETANRLAPQNIVETISLDMAWALIKSAPVIDNHTVAAHQLAYVIYTSGSTGQPKGVMIEHRSLVNLVEWHNKEYRVSAASRATAMAGIGFDAFGWEIWPYLATGASLYLIDDETRLSASRLVKLFQDSSITHSFISTAVVPEFLAASSGKSMALRYLLTGGDKLSYPEINPVGFTLVNNYGPTESTVVATNYHFSTRDRNPIPIGRPILNTTIYHFK